MRSPWLLICDWDGHQIPICCRPASALHCSLTGSAATGSGQTCNFRTSAYEMYDFVVQCATVNRTPTRSPSIEHSLEQTRRIFVNHVSVTQLPGTVSGEA